MKFFKRFNYAFQGLYFLVSKDRNIQVHLIFLLIAVALGVFFEISSLEWIAVILCSTLVICLEAINTIIERKADFMHKEIHPEIKIIKDASAGVVLIASIASLIVGIIIFLPKISAFYHEM